MTQAILDTHEFDRLYSEYKSRFIVIAYAPMDDAEAKAFQATVVKVDAKNRIVKVLRK